VNKRRTSERPRVESYRDHIVWQKSLNLVVAIYRETEEWPQQERFGLVQQLRRCAVSVPSNIAEGQGRRSDREFVHFLRIAHGSLREAETQVTLGQRLGYCSIGTEERMLDRTSEIGRLLQGLIRSITARQQP
jgi:four helix bundle protein